MFRRGRRLKANSAIRSLVRENSLSVDDFIYPVFVVEGKDIKREISSLKGNYHWSVDRLEELVDELNEAKIKSVILFGIPEHKDCVGSEAYNENGIVQKAIRRLRELSPELYIITDVCMCEYTDHGHCGILRNKRVFDEVDYVLFTSPSTVNNMVDMLGLEAVKSKKLIAIGPQTAKAIREKEMECFMCKKHSEEGFLKEIIEFKEAENV